MRLAVSGYYGVYRLKRCAAHPRFCRRAKRAGKEILSVHLLGLPRVKYSVIGKYNYPAAHKKTLSEKRQISSAAALKLERARTPLCLFYRPTITNFNEHYPFTTSSRSVYFRYV